MTTPPQSQPDWREREYNPEQYKTQYQIAGGVILVSIGVIIGALLFRDPGYWANLFTEVISVAVTVGLFGIITEHRHTQQWKARLRHEAGSQSNERAKSAVEDLRWKGWLTVEDKSPLLKGEDLVLANLQGANLWKANLQGAVLGGANLQGALLSYTNLQGADLLSAKLQGADLGKANLQGAKLERANLQDAQLWLTNLQGADLPEANLQGADLERANLQGARLWLANLQNAHLSADLQGTQLHRANLQGANLTGAKFDDKTVLPDRTHWTPDTDMQRFTDPNHPNFWQPPKK